MSTQRTRQAMLSATHTRVVLGVPVPLKLKPRTTATPRASASVAFTLGPPSPLAMLPVLSAVREATEGAERFAKRRRLPAPSVKKRPLPVASVARP